MKRKHVHRTDTLLGRLVTGKDAKFEPDYSLIAPALARLAPNKQVQNAHTQCKLEVKRSPIHGVGVFASAPIRKGTTMHLTQLKLLASRGLNYTSHPNIIISGKKVTFTRNVRRGEEITVKRY